MLTRGHLIGQIVDDLAGIAAQAKQRARLHLFDIHTHVENFAKEVLNQVLSLGLSNLNAEHLNNPGLDLGDATNGWAFQVTADKSGAKVKETLDTIKDDERAKYPNIRILIIGEKQGSYTFKGEPYERFGFKEEMVWDFNDVCSRIMTLSIDALVDLARYVSSETRRVKIELEIPDEEGRFPTSIDNLIEALPKPQLSDASKMEAHFAAKQEPIDRNKAKNAIAELSTKLAALPRLTREVFKLLIERRDDQLTSTTEEYRISDPKLRRIYHGDDLDGDLALLSEVGLIDFNEPHDSDGTYYWRIRFPDRGNSFHLLLIEYAKELGLNLRKSLVTLDFSDF
ncbi:hypothetical protein D7V97_23815 [Corallococcus sp. CA053C]|uniref:SMEK domain-containing protein n=1 Tax=Corallococcus sp. CA053C TaxID=2316732 RepID=UPI000EA0C1F1|nr:SMEK domain-containing protein [Corallococcus sp. CA053C]RKH05528.1 hypothetical protein D7V97_23815 [Corallococcus sp. CA053C]